MQSLTINWGLTLSQLNVFFEFFIVCLFCSSEDFTGLWLQVAGEDGVMGLLRHPSYICIDQGLIVLSYSIVYEVSKKKNK